MNQKFRSTFCIGLLLAISSVQSGCSKTEQTQTVEWYTSHDSERKTMLDKCQNNPGELEKTPNCVNAHAADAANMFSKRGFPVLIPPGEKKK
jgi:predicted Fe-S protein YdhL (DUF1289 family)